MKTMKIERTQHANDLIKVISQHGRRFFWNEKAQRTASLELDARGRVWFIDDYSGKRIYIHPVGSREGWRSFSHGGTLRSLIEAMRDYITHDTRLHPEYIAPERMTPGSNIWGYSTEAAKAVREAAYTLPMFKQTAAA